MLRPMQLDLASLPPTRRYLIGVSGGRDSVALLHHLHDRGYRRLIVCHVNHRLRGRASTGDASFVRRLATRLGLDFEQTSQDVARLARDAAESIETTARRVRHEFFAEVARQYRCPRVILAHHAEDQAETVLMRLLRGTSISGLRGMKRETPLRVGRTTLSLLRPMLHIRRAEIDAFLASHHLAFREDESNQDTRLTRNLLRHEWLGAGFRAPDTRWIDEARHQLASTDALSETCLKTPEGELRVYRGEIYVARHRPDTSDAVVHWRGEDELPWAGGRVRFVVVDGGGIRRTLLESGEVFIRARQGGERLQAHPTRPRRSLRNLLQEASIPAWERNYLPYLWCGDRLAWVAGLGVDVKFACAAGEAGVLPVWEPD